MQMRLNLLRILLVLFVFQRETRATKCYQCKSKTDENCTVNKVDSKHLKACPVSYPYCRKAVYIYYFTNSRDYLTVRECAKWRAAGRECYRGRYTRDSYQLVCECKGAGCNRSSRSTSCVHHYILCQFLIFLLLSSTH